MVIAVDIDNVICNLQEVVTVLFNKQYGTSYTLNDFTEYDVMNVLPTEEAVKMQEMYGASDIYNLVKPIPGSTDALQRLLNDGHNIYLVTDALPSNYAEKVEFIHRYFPFIDDAHIVCIKHKHLFKCDIMVEDNLANLVTKNSYHRICFNMPWNHVSDRDTDLYDEAHLINRCYTWDDILAVINNINEGE